MVKISRVLVEKIIKQAQTHLPIECCGIMGGYVREGFTEIMEVYPMVNLDNSPEHFSMDPQEQFRVFKELRSKGLKLVGNYHSHPETPARPSQEDIRLAYDSQAVYMILSLASEEPVLKAFKIKDGQSSELELNLYE